jgi:TusA-related sulfurtransferase
MVMEKLEKSERGTTLNMLVDCSSTGEEVYGVLQDKGYDVKMVRIKDSEWAIKAKKLI